MKHTIYTQNKQDKIELTPALRALAKKVICAALDDQEIDFPCEISLTFVDNDEIHALNKEYRSKDAPTDVLSFPMFENAKLNTTMKPANRAPWAILSFPSNAPTSKPKNTGIRSNARSDFYAFIPYCTFSAMTMR